MLSGPCCSWDQALGLVHNSRDQAFLLQKKGVVGGTAKECKRNWVFLSSKLLVLQNEFKVLCVLGPHLEVFSYSLL